MWRLLSLPSFPARFRAGLVNRGFSRQRGVLVEWDEKRGIGKVQSQDGRQLFVRRSYLQEAVTQGSSVDFDVQWVEERKQDHAKAVRLVKPETPQMDVAGVAGMAGAMPRFQAIHAEDLMKVEPLILPADATEKERLEMMTRQMDQLRQQGLQSQQLLAQNQQLLVQSQQLLVQGLFALIQQQNIQNANLERALTALTAKMGVEMPSASQQVDLPKFMAPTSPTDVKADLPDPEQRVVDGDEAPSAASAVPASSTTELTEEASEAAEAETSEEEPLEQEPVSDVEESKSTLQAGASEPDEKEKVIEAQAKTDQGRGQRPDKTTEVARDDPSQDSGTTSSYNLVGFFNDWDAENEPMQKGSWRLLIRNGAPMGSRKGVQREEFQILEDASWERRYFPAGGTEETVVLLRPGRLSKAEVSSPRNEGHGRNWAVEGKPGAAFKIIYNSKDRSVSCEHA